MQDIVNFLSGILGNFFKSVLNFFSFFYDFLLNLLGGMMQFLEDALLYIPRAFYSFIMDFADWIFVRCNTCGVNYIYSTILNGLNGLKSLSSQASDYVDFDFVSCLSYLADIFSLNAGFQLLVCAYILKFVIRRIPLFG